MEVLHIGGVANGEHLEISEYVKAGRHSFKPSTAFYSDPLTHHDYERQIFTVRHKDGKVEEVQVMVYDQLPIAEVHSCIEAKLSVHIASSGNALTEDQR